MDVIKAEHLTKDFGDHRGIFDLSFNVSKGEVYGFLGPNGAGKTTTIRHLLGFTKPQSGDCRISGLDCWRQPQQIQSHLGYLPGEPAFPDHLTGYEFLEQIASLRQMESLDRARELIRMFELDPREQIKRMSKGTKQKVALVTAFMHDPDIIILDEPTSGLDPLMQARFIDLIISEKARGKTILLSSHMFAEIEKTCDRVAIIKHGSIITEVPMNTILNGHRKIFEITFSSPAEMTRFTQTAFTIDQFNAAQNCVQVQIQDGQLNELLRELAMLDVRAMTEIKFSLEQYFMKYYQTGESAND